MSKEIQYLKLKFIKEEYNLFIKKEFDQIVNITKEKYSNIFSDKLIFDKLTRKISITAFSSLTVSLYLECAEKGDSSSYREQFTMLYDLRALSSAKRKPQSEYFYSRKLYNNQYEELCDLVDGFQHFQKDRTIPDVINDTIEKHKENFSPEQIENILLFSKEITLQLIARVTQMIESQLYRYFPSKASVFVKDILGIDPSEEYKLIDIETSSDSSPHSPRRVSFAL